MAALYVAYSASKPQPIAPASVTGWIVLNNRAEPQSIGEIHSICDRIAEVESVEHVIPIWWREIDRAVG